MKKSVYLINLPKYEADTVPLGPAILQTVAIRCGYTPHFTDLNLELSEGKDQDKGMYDAWISGLGNNLPFSTLKSYIQLCDTTIKQIIDVDPEHVGVSFFSRESLTYGHVFLRRLKTMGYPGKVSVGGPGISRSSEESIEKLVDDQLVDYYVLGDGEVAFEKILKQELPYPGVNNRNHIAITDMDNLPLPNFDNFELDRYPKMFNKKTLGIEGSRGCVRDCGFCDIKVLFLKYRYKSGGRLFKEIMHNIKQNNVYTFWFTDSLVNGNQKEFRVMLRLLSDYNNKAPQDKRISWTGQYIVRPQKQYIEEDFKLLVDSGCYTLATGIESYSESVRKQMGKNFSNDDIHWFFNKCQEYNISLFIMMVIGYPTETQKDFEDTLTFFDEFEHLADDDTISGLQLGHTMIMIPGTPAWKQQDKLGVTYEQLLNVNKSNSWRNANSDIKERIKRRLIAQKKALQRGFGIRSSQDHIDMFKRWIHGV